MLLEGGMGEINSTRPSVALSSLLKRGLRMRSTMHYFFPPPREAAMSISVFVEPALTVYSIFPVFALP
jgi:hypothetical protein